MVGEITTLRSNWNIKRSATLLGRQVEQDVVILPVDGTISNPVSAVTEEITVVLNENETRMLLQETLSTHRVQINEVLLAHWYKLQHVRGDRY